MDVDKHSIHVALYDHNNNIKTMKTSYDARHVMNYVNKQYPGQRVLYAYEAGPTGFGLYDEITKAGNTCFVVSASSIPHASNERVKTNRIDSEKIAESLRSGHLRSIHVPTEAYRELRHLGHLRDTYVSQYSRTKQRIKSLLLLEGIAFPGKDSQERWNNQAIAKLQELGCSNTLRFKLDSYLGDLVYHHHHTLETSKQIRDYCKKNEELSRNMEFLKSLPGIGVTTAHQLLARIGDWRQLTHPNQIGAFLGLVTSERSTGDDIDRGSITKLGDCRLRNKLIQCAWISIRTDKELKEFYERIYKSHTKKYAARIAIVAVARKLTTRIYAVLKEQRNYEIREKVTLNKEDYSLPGGRLGLLQNLTGSVS
jgi:transposase